MGVRVLGVFLLCLLASLIDTFVADDVKVEIVLAHPDNAKVTTQHFYDAMVTLFVENDDGTTTQSGWSTRKEQGGNGKVVQ